MESRVFYAPIDREEWLAFVRDPQGFSGDPNMHFGPPEGCTTAVAYSGFIGMNAQFSKDDCLADGSKYRIEDTGAGRYMNDADLYTLRSVLSPQEADEVWGLASTRYAASIEGPAVTNVVDANPERQFRQMELPTMLSNDRIPDINGVPCDELRQLSPDEQYDRICQAELERDRSAAQQPGGDVERVEWKELAYQEHRERQFGLLPSDESAAPSTDELISSQRQVAIDNRAEEQVQALVTSTFSAGNSSSESSAQASLSGYKPAPAPVPESMPEPSPSTPTV